MSKLDYCNSLLSGSPKHLLGKLQKVQTSAARLVFKARTHEHIKPLLQNLHWLPAVSRIQYKVATLCYNSFTESYTVNLSELLTVYHPSRQLRSISDTRTFRIPFTKTKTFGQRAFSFTGPTQWNSLPYDIRHSLSTSSFKQALKTHLFKSAYNSYPPPPPPALPVYVCVCVCARARVCVCVCVCVCAISRCTFLYLQYIYLYHTCVLVWSCLVTDNFGLFTEIAVCKLLRGWRSYGANPFYFVHCMCLYISAAFCTAHCALDLARDHAPQKCPLIL